MQVLALADFAHFRRVLLVGTTRQGAIRCATDYRARGRIGTSVHLRDTIISYLTRRVMWRRWCRVLPAGGAVGPSGMQKVPKGRRSGRRVACKREALRRVQQRWYQENRERERTRRWHDEANLTKGDRLHATPGPTQPAC